MIEKFRQLRQRFIEMSTATSILSSVLVGTVLSVTIVLMVGYKLPIRGVPNWKTFESMVPVPKLEAAERAYTIPAPIVNLPQGQHFMYIIPATQTTTIGLVKPGRDVYVTYEMTTRCDNMAVCPKIIRFLQPGDMPLSWQEVLRIHEH